MEWAKGIRFRGALHHVLPMISTLLVHAVISPSEACEHFVADGAAGLADFVDAEFAADEGDELTAARRVVWYIRDVDRQQIHGNAAGERAAPARQQHVGRRFALVGPRGAQIAVGVADRDDSDLARLCRLE